MRIVCWQTILMKYHALLVIFQKAPQFEIVVCDATLISEKRSVYLGMHVIPL